MDPRLQSHRPEVRVRGRDRFITTTFKTSNETRSKVNVLTLLLQNDVS